MGVGHVFFSQMSGVGHDGCSDHLLKQETNFCSTEVHDLCKMVLQLLAFTFVVVNGCIFYFGLKSI